METKKIETRVKHIKKSAQKVRIPADIVRGMNALEAVQILEYMPKFAAKDVYKAINTALSDAKNNFGIEPDGLYISEIRVDEGPSYKRYKEGGKGSYRPFHRKSSHIYVCLTEISAKQVEKPAKKKVEEKVEQKITKKSVSKSSAKKAAKPKKKVAKK